MSKYDDLFNLAETICANQNYLRQDIKNATKFRILGNLYVDVREVLQLLLDHLNLEVQYTPPRETVKLVKKEKKKREKTETN
jgi:hypothetical protein